MIKKDNKSKKGNPEFAGAVSSMDWDLASINSYKEEEKSEPAISYVVDSKESVPKVESANTAVSKSNLATSKRNKPTSSVKPTQDILLKEKISFTKPKKTLEKILNADGDELFSKNTDFLKLVFRTERSFLEKYITLCNKLFIKLDLDRKKQSYAYIFHLVINMMKVDYEQTYKYLLYPTEDETLFYKNNVTKGSHHVDIDQIVDRDSLTIKINIPDYELLFALMNTKFKNFETKPTRYSINFFFFEVVRFMNDKMI